MSRQLSGDKKIRQILNIFKEIVKLNVVTSAEKAVRLNQSYVAGWEIDPENVFKHYNDCPTEAGKWRAITMSIPIGSPPYLKHSLNDSDGSRIHLLNKDFGSLMISDQENLN